MHIVSHGTVKTDSNGKCIRGIWFHTISYYTNACSDKGKKIKVKYLFDIVTSCNYAG